MDEILEQLFLAKPARALFHYSSLDALIKIVESQAMFASEAHFLNDTAEVIHFSNIVGGVLSTAKDHYPTQVHPILDQLIQWLLIRKHEKPLVFVASFSQEGNLLSQWRSYCPPWKGVSIGFLPSTLIEAAESQRFSLGECVYDLGKQKQIAIQVVDAFIDNAKKLGPSPEGKAHPTQSYFKSFEALEADFVRICCLIKHPAFSEEREWRVVSLTFPNYVEPPIEYRVGTSSLVPYMKFQLPHKDKKVLIDRVYLGPTSDPRLSMRSLSMFLSKNSACKNVINCDTPYRDY